MTKLLEQAFAQLRELPEDFQDKAARQLIRYVNEVSTDDRTELEESWQTYLRGDHKTLKQWRNEMGLGDH